MEKEEYKKHVKKVTKETKDYVDQEVSRLVARFADIEKRLYKLEEKKIFDPNVTIVATGLAQEQKHIYSLVSTPSC